MSLFSIIKKNFIKGLYITLPIFLTYYIIELTINFLSKQFYFIHSYVDIPFLKEIPYSEIIIILLMICLIGIINSFLHLEKIIFIIEDFFLKHIPLVSSLYQGIKKITKIIKKNNNNTNDTQMVAWVKLPHLNIYSLGLLTGALEEKYCPEQEKKFFSFFIPTTPNPLTGYYIIAAEGEFMFTSMTRQEAISMIISGGIIHPEKEE